MTAVSCNPIVPQSLAHSFGVSGGSVTSGPSGRAVEHATAAKATAQTSFIGILDEKGISRRTAS